MSEYTREIEQKYVVEPGNSFLAIKERLVSMGASPVEHGISTDQFWQAPNVDFVRFRNNTSELTVKVTDQGSISDRIEENVPVGVYAESCKKVLNLLFGNQVLALTKRFAVLNYNDVILSLYEVQEDPKQRLFLEIEGPSLAQVMHAGAELLQVVPVKTLEERSLFQIMTEEGVR